MTETPKIMPGDVVVLRGEYIGVEDGARAVVDSHYFDPDGDGEIMACFRASAFRQDPKDNEVRLGIVEMIEMGMTGGSVNPYVSCSGGPLPFIKVAELEYLGDTTQNFWNWGKGFPRAGGAVPFTATVNMWAWSHDNARLRPALADELEPILKPFGVERTGEIKFEQTGLGN